MSERLIAALEAENAELRKRLTWFDQEPVLYDNKYIVVMDDYGETEIIRNNISDWNRLDMVCDRWCYLPDPTDMPPPVSVDGEIELSH